MVPLYARSHWHFVYVSIKIIAGINNFHYKAIIAFDAWSAVKCKDHRKISKKLIKEIRNNVVPP